MNRDPVLARYDLQVFTRINYPIDTSGALFMAFGVPVWVFAQGATASAAAQVPSNLTSEVDIPVYNTGSVQITGKDQNGVPGPGMLFWNGDTSKKVQVTGVTGGANPSIRVKNTTTNGFPVAIGDRFVVSVPAAFFYKDPLGTVSLGPSLTTDAVLARVGGYIKEYRFDTVVYNLPTGTRLHIDQVGGFVMRG